MTHHLDFWNYPDWLGDSRDNPRDPGFEPFWMRDTRETGAPNCHRGGHEFLQRMDARTGHIGDVCLRCGYHRTLSHPTPVTYGTVRLRGNYVHFN